MKTTKVIPLKKEGYVIDIESLMNEVNKCDKHLGVKLKKANVFTEPDKVFEVACSEAQMYLSSLISVINGIDIDEYYSSDEDYGEISGPIGIQNMEFTDLSQLDWRGNDKYYTDTLMFKCRFLTIFLTDYMLKLDKMAMNKYKDSTNKIGVYEHGYFYIKSLLADAKRLTITMLSSDDYGNILLKCHQNFVNAKNKMNRRKYNKNVYEAVISLKTGIKKSIFNEEYLEDDMAIYTILRLAYMLSTNDLDMKHLPKFKYIEGATKENDLKELIATLGAAILGEVKYKKRPLMYKAFNNASPIIRTNYSDVNEDWYVSIGIRSLAYTDFICNDKTIHKFIEKMMNQ